MANDDHALEDVLAQHAWISRLARRLVVDEAERDDIVQQAWLAALSGANQPRAVRPWLFGLVRNVARMELRGNIRRRNREEAAPPSEATPSPEELSARVELDRQVAAAVLTIAEPYRQTLLLRYYEDLSPTEIARRLKIPAGTVRWRLKEALSLLRSRLDQRFKGDRRRWGLALIPTAAALRDGSVQALGALGGALLLKTALKLTAGGLCLLLLWLTVPRLFRGQQPTAEATRAPVGTPWRHAAGASAPSLSATAATVATIEGIEIPLWFGQRGAPVRRIAGRVTAAGAPLEGATVELGSALSDAGVLPVLTRRTGSDGAFDFGAQPPAAYSLAASAQQHSPAVTEVDTRNPTAAAERVELRLGGCAAALFGHVDDSSGGPIAQARICDAWPRASACVVSDDSGAYEACLDPGERTVAIAARGYGAVVERVTFTSRRVRRDFALTPEATIVGRVVRADSGAPVAGAEVRAVGVDQWTPRWSAPHSTVTNGEGRFTLAGLAAGRHRLSAAAAGLASSQWLELSVQPGRIGNEIVLPLLATARVSGTVTDGHDAVAGATVAVQSPLPGDAVTQADGSFVLDNVPRGTQPLQVAPYSVRDPRAILVDGPEVTNVRITVELMASIAGTITRSGKPVAGALVYSGRGEAVSADGEGRYVVRGLPPGKYYVSADDKPAGAFGAAPDVTVAAGEQRTGVDIDLRHGGTIAGTIVEANGAPAGGLFVRFEALHRIDGGEDVTAPDGSFRVGTLIGDDDYRPYVRPAPLSNQRFEAAHGVLPTVHVADGASHVDGVQLVIERAHQKIAGAVTDGDGQPLPDVRVSAWRSDSGEAPMFWGDRAAAITGADGRFILGDLDGGRYTLDARGGDGSEATVENVGAGTSGVVVALQASGGVDGTLIGFRAPPSVSAAPTRQDTWPIFAAVSGTTFRLRGLAPGTYTITAAGTGSAAERVQVQSGQLASVTLRDGGGASVGGRVYDWRSGAPAPGFTCRAGLRVGDGTPVWDSTNLATSDGDGRYRLDGVAAGNVAVRCVGPSPFFSDGAAPLVVTAGQAGSADIPIIERASSQPPGSAGFQLDDAAFLAARVLTLQPRGPADRAGLRVGDTIKTVDGKSIAGLTSSAVKEVILGRPIGTTARLGVTRTEAPIQLTIEPYDGVE